MNALLSGYDPSRRVVDPVRDAPARQRARQRELARIQAKYTSLCVLVICDGCRRFVVAPGSACRGCGGVA